MADMTLEEKVRLLKLKPITNEVYINHLKDWELRGQDVKQFKYYKMYDETPMFYTEEYLITNTLDELINKHKHFKKTFGYSFFGRIRRKIHVMLLRWGL